MKREAVLEYTVNSEEKMEMFTSSHSRKKSTKSPSRHTINLLEISQFAFAFVKSKLF